MLERSSLNRKEVENTKKVAENWNVVLEQKEVLNIFTFSLLSIACKLITRRFIVPINFQLTKLSASTTVSLFTKLNVQIILLRFVKKKPAVCKFDACPFDKSVCTNGFIKKGMKLQPAVGVSKQRKLIL